MHASKNNNISPSCPLLLRRTLDTSLCKSGKDGVVHIIAPLYCTGTYHAYLISSVACVLALRAFNRLQKLPHIHHHPQHPQQVCLRKVSKQGLDSSQGGQQSARMGQPPGGGSLMSNGVPVLRNSQHRDPYSQPNQQLMGVSLLDKENEGVR